MILFQELQALKNGWEWLWWHVSLVSGVHVGSMLFVSPLFLCGHLNCSGRGPELCSQHSGQAAHYLCNSSSRGSIIWCLCGYWHLQAHTHTQTLIIHIIEKRVNPLKRHHKSKRASGRAHLAPVHCSPRLKTGMLTLPHVCYGAAQCKRVQHPSSHARLCNQLYCLTTHIVFCPCKHNGFIIEDKVLFIFSPTILQGC